MVNYLNWRSNLGPAQVFSERESYSYPHGFASGFLYLTSLTDELGRSAIMYQPEIIGQQSQCVTPKGFNLRTRICEYGGKPFWLFGNKLVFTNDSDQCLYQQELSITGSRLEVTEPQRVSSLPNEHVQYMFAEVNYVSDRYYLAICEIETLVSPQESKPKSENQSAIVLIDTLNPDSPPELLHAQGDFHNNLVVCAKDGWVAWVQWNHPNMPWDENSLMVAELCFSQQGKLSLKAPRVISLPSSASVCQLVFGAASQLYFSVDFASCEKESVIREKEGLSANAIFWNIWVADLRSFSPIATPVTDEALEFGYPHWQFSDHRIVKCSGNSLLAIGSEAAEDILFEIDVASRQVRSMGIRGWSFQNLSSAGDGKFFAIAQSTTQSESIVRVDCNLGSIEVLRSNKALLELKDVSRPTHISFSTRDGRQAHGFYYPPTNSNYLEHQDDKPPLLVMVHGGPTARCYGYFDLQKQFWTQHGFAIFDVNHRGSSGYGRNYRDALYGEWGIGDCTDIVDGIQYLLNSGKACENKVVIRGKSAGGYAVLRALTEYPHVFKAGACYYGIGNLATLAQVTHKFESHYTDRLIGEAYDEVLSQRAESEYQVRSPNNRLANIASSMIIFQGGLDKVVPPSLAHETIEVLRRLGLSYQYEEYPDEGHGFRTPATNIDSLNKELAFYRANLQD